MPRIGAASLDMMSANVGAVERSTLDLLACELPRELPCEPTELALELTHARLTGVRGDDLAHRVVGERELFRGQAVRLELALHEVALRDLELLLLGVTREVDDLHTVEERTRDVLDEVRGRDEHDLAEV